MRTTNRGYFEGLDDFNLITRFIRHERKLSSWSIGRFVACCEALIDSHNSEADIERICTHSDFRKRGFARAMIQECLFRLRGMGLRQAHICGYRPEAISLYGSLGAVSETKGWIYERAMV